MRTMLGIASAINLLAAVALPVAHSAFAAADALTVMSTYHELDVNGVIDHAKLATYDGGRFARNEWAIPDFLNHNRRSVLPLVLPADSDQNRRATQQ